MDNSIAAITPLQAVPQSVATSHGTFYRLYDVHFTDGTARHTLVPVNVQNVVLSYPSACITSDSNELKGATLSMDSKIGVAAANDVGPTSTIKFVMNPAYSNIISEQINQSKFRRFVPNSHVNSPVSYQPDLQEVQVLSKNEADIDDDCRYIEKVDFSKEDKLNPEIITILVDPNSYIYPDDEVESTDITDISSLKTLLEQPFPANAGGVLVNQLLTCRDQLLNENECDIKNINTTGDENNKGCTVINNNNIEEVKPKNNKLRSAAKHVISNLVQERNGTHQSDHSYSSPLFKTCKNAASYLLGNNVNCSPSLKSRAGQKTTKSRSNRRTNGIKTGFNMKPQIDLEHAPIRNCSVSLQRIRLEYLHNGSVDLKQVSENMLFESECSRITPVKGLDKQQRKRKSNHQPILAPNGKRKQRLSVRPKGRRKRRAAPKKKTIQIQVTNNHGTVNSGVCATTDANNIVNISPETTCCTLVGS